MSGRATATRFPLRRTAAAVAIAYALILQSLLAGFAGGANAAPDPLRTAALVLCLPGGSDAPAPTRAPHQPGSLCCVLGCVAAAQHAVSVDGGAPVAAPELYKAAHSRGLASAHPSAALPTPRARGPPARA